MFVTKRKNRVAIAGEPERHVYTVLSFDNNKNSWSPSKINIYLRDSQGECEHDPTEKVLDVARKGGNIVDAFVLYADIDLWYSIVQCTNKYANDECVAEMKVNINDEPPKEPHQSRAKHSIRINAIVRTK